QMREPETNASRDCSNAHWVSTAQGALHPPLEGEGRCVWSERNEQRGRVISKHGHRPKPETVTPPRRSLHSRRPCPPGRVRDDLRNHFAAAAFLHSERNFLRSLPCSPLASACFEHSSDSAVRAFFSAGVLASAGALVSVFVVSLAAGAVVCAKAVPISSREARVVAVAREESLVMGHLDMKGG